MAPTGHGLLRRPLKTYCRNHSNHTGSSKQTYNRWRQTRAGKPCSNRLGSHIRMNCCHICVGNQPGTLGTSKWHHDCRQHKHGSGHTASSLRSTGPTSPALDAICLQARPRCCHLLSYDWKEGGFPASVFPKSRDMNSERQRGEWRWICS